MFGISDKDLKSTFGELAPVGEILSNKMAGIASGGGLEPLMAATATREAVVAKADDAFTALYPDQNARLDTVNELRKILPRFWDVVGVDAEDLRKSLVEALNSDKPYENFIKVLSEPLHLLVKEVIDIMRDHAHDDLEDKVEVTVRAALQAAYQGLENRVLAVKAKDWDYLLQGLQGDRVRICCALDEAFAPVAIAS